MGHICFLWNFFYVLCLLKPIASTGQFASAPNAVRLIVAKEGFRGLYVGFAIFVGVYEPTKPIAFVSLLFSS